MEEKAMSDQCLGNLLEHCKILQALIAVRNFLGSAFFQFQTAYSDSVPKCGFQWQDGAFE